MIKWFFLAVPVLVWLVFFGVNRWQSLQIEEKLLPADGLKFSSGGASLAVDISESHTGEMTNYTIEVKNDHGRVVDSYHFSVDWDMFGGGFVAAVNIDGDDVLEIVAWGAHESEKSFYLDFDTSLNRVLARELSPPTRILTEKWYQTEVRQPMELTILVLLMFLYYVLVGFLLFIHRLLKRRKIARAAP